MNVFQHMRLFVYRGYVATMGIFPPILSRLPGITHANVNNLELIGPKNIVDQALEVLADFESASLELRSELDAKGTIIFCYSPLWREDVSIGRHLFIGNSSLAWGKTGLLAHMVWTALKLRVDLQDPTTSFRDAYAGQRLLKSVLSDMVDWLTTYQQPAELIESVLAVCAKHGIQPNTITQ